MRATTNRSFELHPPERTTYKLSPDDDAADDDVWGIYRCAPGERWADADEPDHDEKHDKVIEVDEQRGTTRPALRIVRALMKSGVSTSRPTKVEDCEAADKGNEQAEDAADVKQAIPPRTGSRARSYNIGAVEYSQCKGIAINGSRTRFHTSYTCRPSLGSEGRGGVQTCPYLCTCTCAIMHVYCNPFCSISDLNFLSVVRQNKSLFCQLLSLPAC